ncbi:MAG: hypothetical protein ACK56W_14385 [Pirellula sp.]|jgi:hypothetical protein|nr:hypothetical protein [Pirellula sp.]
MQKISPLLLRYGFVALFCLVLSVTGCDQPGKKAGAKSTPSIAAKDRPPIRIMLLEHSLEEDLKLRWSSFSEQPIEIEKVSVDQLAEPLSDKADVWIFPALLTGDMIALNCISPLPNAAVGKPFDIQDSPEGQPSRSVTEQWPARWRSASRFGASLIALPLGSPQLVAVSRNVSLKSLDPLDDPNNAVDDRSSIAAQVWSAILVDSSGYTANPERMKQLISSTTDAQRDAIVDRFLWIASTTNAKRRGFFDLNKLKAKLSSPDFVLAADALSVLAAKFPETFLTTHEEAWSSIVSAQGKTKSIAIAFPSDTAPSNELDNRNSAESEALQISKIVWNPTGGLLASVGKKTRQTSVASQFIAWLSDGEQRNTLAERSSSVERWPAQPSKNSIREDYRLYQNLNNRDSRMEQTTLSIRFQSARKYRSILADTLLEIIQQPETSREKLEECSQKWNALTESIGLSNIRPSIEQATGFSQ